MGYDAKVIADSRGPNGARLTTFQLRFPRLVLAQLNTHRAISKNARSSRAVPVEKLIAEAETDPVMPLYWGRNRKGMSATEELEGDERSECEWLWLKARDEAVTSVRRLVKRGAHKQIVNRLLEPFLWVDVVATATDWSNFFALRCERHAQPEMQVLAVMMARVLRGSEPVTRPYSVRNDRDYSNWHLPYVTDAERDHYYLGDLRALSVARSARVSYLAFDGTNVPQPRDFKLHDELRDNGHFSPFEHQGQAQPAGRMVRSGNFLGWHQYRQSLSKNVHTSFDYNVLDQFGDRGFIV